jgi:PPP family 3-phenylpropionic acid transporter
LTTSPAALPSDPVAPPREGQRSKLALGVASLYFAVYLHYGYFAFMPLWLKKTGVPAAEIGILLSIPLILRLLTVAPFSAWAGHRGRVRDAITATGLLSAMLILLLLGKPDYATRIAIVIAFSLVWDQLPVLADAYAGMAVRSHRIDFGQVRVWGSIAVVGSTATAGWVIGAIGLESLPVLISILLLLPAIASPFLPSDRLMAAAETGPVGKWRDLLRDRQLMRALVAATLIIGSHGMLTNFAVIQWNEQGLSTGMIGTLQAVAISVEIAGFLFGGKLLGSRDPALLIRIAAPVAVLRWAVMATNPGLAVLFAVQLLNGVTSTGAILGAMLVVAQRVPVQLTATAQALNAVLLGVVLAVVTFGSGLLWAHGALAAYGAMAMLASLGGLLAWTGAPSKCRAL